MTRPRHFSTKPPAKYKWCGTSGNDSVPIAPTALVDIELLCSSLGITDIQGDVTIEKILLDISIQRLLTTQIQQVGMMVGIQKITSTSGLPVESLRPVDAVTANFQLGNRDLLLQGRMSIPPTIDLAGARVVDFSTINHHWEFNGRRKLHRMNHALTLTIQADTANVLQYVFQSRVLLRYS